MPPLATPPAPTPADPRVALIVPTKDAGAFAPRLIEAVRGQSLRPHRLVALDSGSRDGTPDLFRRAGWEVVAVPPERFDHGATRQLGIARVADCECDCTLALLLTQDAIPADPAAFERLAGAFADPAVGLAYGRQLPRPDARATERFARGWHYPARPHRRTAADLDRLGFSACFCSNSFAAYRLEALAGVGGFPARLIFAEDQVTAGRLLLAGWTLAYVADAMVEHSHAHGPLAEARRSFDAGVLFAANPWLTTSLGRPEGAGRRFAAAQLRHLLRHAPGHLPEAALRTGLRYLHYRLGRQADRLPAALVLRLSANPAYWTGRVADDQAPGALPAEAAPAPR